MSVVRENHDTAMELAHEANLSADAADKRYLYEQARSADDTLIRRIATEMMGYAPGSAEDLRRQLEAARGIVEEAERQKLAAERHFDWWQRRVEMLERELAVVGTSQPTSLNHSPLWVLGVDEDVRDDKDAHEVYKDADDV